MEQQKKFKKVVTWNRLDLNGKSSFILGFFILIPFVNIIIGIALISMAWDNLEIHWEEIK